VARNATAHSGDMKRLQAGGNPELRDSDILACNDAFMLSATSGWKQ